MKTVGELLRQERVKQHKTLEQIAEKTKIRPGILDHLEKGEYHFLPSRTYVQGFVKAYAHALKMDSEKALAFFRREYDMKEHDQPAPPQPLRRTGPIITPGKLVTIAGTLLLLLFFGVLFWQYRQFAGRPVLIIDYPPDQTVTQRPFINVSGKTDPEAEILVNDQNVPVTAEGSFQVTINLQEGTNRITVVAKNSIGKETVLEREVQVVLEQQ
jgi:cytoskeletal protein RodZ